MATTEPRPRQRGQVLPLGLAGLVCGLVLFGLCLRLGARVIQRERVRMRCDLTALSGGIQTARCLNLLSCSEKLRVTGEVLSYIPVTSMVGEPLQEALNLFQKFFVPVAPWVVEGDVVMMGNANEIVAIPLWNQKDAFASLSYQALKPDLRAHGSSSSSSSNSSSNSDSDSGSSSSGQADDRAKASGLGSLDLGALGKLLSQSQSDESSSEDDDQGYHYQSESSGQTHHLGGDEAGADQWQKSNGKTVTGYRDKRSGKFVSKDKAKTNTGFGLTDDGDHYVAVLALQDPDQDRALLRPGWNLAAANVRIAGGDLSAFSLKGADYGAYFVPVRGGDQDSDSGLRSQLPKFLAVARSLGVDPGVLGNALGAAAQALDVQH